MMEAGETPANPDTEGDALLDIIIKEEPPSSPLANPITDSPSHLFPRKQPTLVMVTSPQMLSMQAETFPPTPTSTCTSSMYSDNDSDARSSPNQEKLLMPSPSFLAYSAGLPSAQESTESLVPNIKVEEQSPISCYKPKLITQMLYLTEEEKQLLKAEGHPIPYTLPLSNEEQRLIRRIRRKINNRICAQESRRKRRQYMQALEKRVLDLSKEKQLFEAKFSSLEEKTRILLLQMQQKQMMSEETSEDSDSIMPAKKRRDVGTQTDAIKTMPVKFVKTELPDDYEHDLRDDERR